MSVHADINQGVCLGLVLEKVSGDSYELLSADAVKSYIRVDFADDDFILSLMLAEAIEYAEKFTGLSLRQSSYVATYDSVALSFELPMGPNCVVESVVDSSGNDIVFFMTSSQFAKINFPIMPYGPVIITYSAGYLPGTIPAGIITALLKMVATDYDIRANFEVVRGTLIEYNNDSKSLLKQHMRKAWF